MKATQLPWLTSALCMTAGLYLLAGPFQSERAGVAHLLPLWALLTVYEFLVIGMIAVLRRRGADPSALTLVSIFFLADPIFMGDAFASVGSHEAFLISAGASALSLVKAWVLCRACGYSPTPWRAGWVSAALVSIHQIPNLNAATGTQPALVVSLLATWVLAALSVPLWRDGRLGRLAVGALLVHALATGLVSSLEFQLDHLTGPLLAVSALLPWPRYGWIPLPAALYTSPLRPWIKSQGSTTDGLGTALVAGAFLLLGIGFWRSLRPGPPAPQKQSAVGRYS